MSQFGGWHVSDKASSSQHYQYKNRYLPTIVVSVLKYYLDSLIKKTFNLDRDILTILLKAILGSSTQKHGLGRMDWHRV